MASDDPADPRDDESDRAHGAAPDDPTTAGTAPGNEDELERLRRLLIGIDGAEFAALVRSIRDPGQRTAAVAEVISEAVAKRAQSDESLGDTLAPTIEGALHRSIDRNPEPIANAIYPVIGPSVRKAIASAITDVIQGLNRAVEQQFSPQALRWRWQAWRAGLSYTEYLFANNINYAIDHAFLFHRETSLLLQHVAADPEFEADSDMVSSMLSAMTTALTDFMHDSFSSDSEAARRSWSVDEHNIHVLAGEFAVVAIVTRGTPPANKLAQMSDFLDRAHVQQREALRAFDGDASVFASLRAPLEDLLRTNVDADASEDEASRSTSRRPSGWPFAVLTLVLVALLLGWLWRDWQFGAEARALTEALEQEPGYQLLDVRRDGDVLRMEGLRDPLASPFDAWIADRAERLQVEGRFGPYFSAAPEIVGARLLAALAPPAGALAVLEDGVLRVTGVASEEWLTRARTLAATAGSADISVDASGLMIAATPRQRFEALRAGLERERLYFEAGEAELSDAQQARVADVAAELLVVLGFIEELELDARIIVVGQSDSTGTIEVNRVVSNARANHVRDALVEQGVPAEMLVPEARIIGDVDADARQVRFEIAERVTN